MDHISIPTDHAPDAFVERVRDRFAEVKRSIRQMKGYDRARVIAIVSAAADDLWNAARVEPGARADEQPHA